MLLHHSRSLPADLHPIVQGLTVISGSVLPIGRSIKLILGMVLPIGRRIKLILGTVRPIGRGIKLILGTVRPIGQTIKLIHKNKNKLLKSFLNKLVEDFNANLTFDKGSMSFDKGALPLSIIAEITLPNQEEIIMGWLWFRFTHRGLFNSCSNIVFGFNLHV